MRARGEALQPRLFEVGIFAGELEARPQPAAVDVRPLTDQFSPANLLFEHE
jgi:hypothetical protein